MRILNLGIDTLFVKGRYIDGETKGADTCNIEFILGEPLYDIVNTKNLTETIPNYMYFGGDKGFTIGSDKLLERSNYQLTMSEENIPYVMDKRGLVLGNYNLLYTSVYNLDFTNIVNEFRVYARDSNDFKRIKVIAGGYVNIGEVKHISLMLLVPREIKFINHGDIKETFKDKLVQKFYKHNRTIQELLIINDYKIKT